MYGYKGLRRNMIALRCIKFVICVPDVSIFTASLNGKKTLVMTVLVTRLRRQYRYKMTSSFASIFKMADCGTVNLYDFSDLQFVNPLFLKITQG